MSVLNGYHPLFLDTAAHDFRLLPCSPARDAGSNAIVDSLGLLTDIAGDPRIQGGTVDMGAYESPAFAIGVDSVAAAPCAEATGTVSLGLGTGCPPFFLSWNGPGGTTGSTISDTSFIMLEVSPGSYTITVTDGRMDSDTILVIVEGPPQLTATTTTTAVVCPGGPGGTITATVQGGTAPYTYLWSNADTSFVILEGPAGSYTVTVTDANGCSLTDSVTVETTGQLTLSIDVTPTNCHDSGDGTAAITPLDGTAPFGWLWETGETDSLLTGLPPGSYAVTATDGNGCTGAATALIDSSTQIQIMIDTILPASAAGVADGAVLIGLVFGGTPPHTYQWSNGTMEQSLHDVLPGPYSLTVTDADSCQNVFYFTVDVANAAGEEQVLPFQAVIVPNPSGTAGAELWLKATQPQLLTVQVFDTFGRVLFSKEVFAQMGETRQDLPERLPPGVYWVAVKNGDGAMKVVKWVVM